MPGVRPHGHRVGGRGHEVRRGRELAVAILAAVGQALDVQRAVAGDVVVGAVADARRGNAGGHAHGHVHGNAHGHAHAHGRSGAARRGMPERTFAIDGKPARLAGREARHAAHQHGLRGGPGGRRWRRRGLRITETQQLTVGAQREIGLLAHADLHHAFERKLWRAAVAPCKRRLARDDLVPRVVRDQGAA